MTRLTLACLLFVSCFVSFWAHAQTPNGIPVIPTAWDTPTPGARATPGPRVGNPWPNAPRSGDSAALPRSMGAGPSSSVEFNPADLYARRVRLDVYTLLIESLAFGVGFDVQDVKTATYLNQNGSLGVSLVQHFQGAGMRGVFLKGEVSAFLADYTVEPVNVYTSRTHHWVSGLGFEADLGVRIPMSDHTIVSGAYGVRRRVADFFGESAASRAWVSLVNPWEPRLYLALGVSY